MCMVLFILQRISIINLYILFESVMLVGLVRYCALLDCAILYM